MGFLSRFFQNAVKSSNFGFSNSNSVDTTSQLPSRNQKNFHNFLIVYFHFSYVLFCSPFWIGEESNGWFKLRTWIPQKIAFVLLNCISVGLWLTDLRQIIPNVFRSRNPLKYFQFLERCFALAFQVLTLQTFWSKHKDFVNILNFIRSETRSLPKEKSKILHVFFSRLVCTLFAVMGMYEVIWRIILAPSHTWHETIWNRELVSYGRYAFFITDNMTSTIKTEDLSGKDYFFAVFIGLAYIQRYISGYYTDLSVLFAVLTVWSATYLFSKSLETSLKIDLDNNGKWHAGPGSSASLSKPQNLNWNEIYQTYQSIRDLCQLVNVAFGRMLMVYIAYALLFHSMSMDSILIVDDLRKRIRLLFFICNSTCAFILSADANTRLESLKSWLSRDENRQNVPIDQMNVVMHDLDSHVVGIRGGNIFTITYANLWHMMTTVITYFIICLQTRQQERDMHSIH